MSVHHDPKRLEFGFERPAHGFHSRFDSALHQMKDSRDEMRWVAVDIAEAIANGNDPSPLDIDTYRQRKAIAAYHRAVYDVEAAKVRLR